MLVIAARDNRLVLITSTTISMLTDRRFRCYTGVLLVGLVRVVRLLSDQGMGAGSPP